MLEFETTLLTVFTELYKKLHYFNYSTDILNFVLKYSVTKKAALSNVICSFYEYIWGSDNPNLCKLTRPGQIDFARKAGLVYQKA